MIFLDGLSGIADRYDLFLLDQFGVLHDGIGAYPGALAALQGIASGGKAAAIISNSGRSGAFNRQRMIALGFPDSILPEVITSGDCLPAWLEVHAGGRRLRIYSTGPIDGTLAGALPVADPEQADLLLFNSFSHAQPDDEAIGRILANARSRKIPMVCTNPDEIAIKGGQTFRSPGSFARDYQRLGGVVAFIGKPFPLIFERVLGIFPDIPRDRVLCVGDSLEHDVRGARSVGLDCAWILNGVHRSEFTQVSPADRPARAAELAAGLGLEPTFALDELSW